MAEKAILSNMMQEPERFIPKATSGGINETVFYLPGNQILFRTIVDDFHKHGTIDLTAFIQQRSRDGDLDALGGISQVAEVFSYSRNAAGWTQWVQQVKDTFALRLAQAASRGIHDAATGEDAVRLIEDALERVRKASEGPRRSLDARDAARLFLDALERDRDSGGLPGASTGIAELDAICGGMRPGELWVACARTSRGKSVLLNQTAAEFLTTGKRVAVFSLEMMGKEVVGRLASNIGRVSMEAITQPKKLTKHNLRTLAGAITAISESKLHVDDTAGQTLDAIAAECQRINDVHGGLDLVVVDYIQLVSVERGRNETREREIARISAGLKQLAKKLECPVFTASQLNEQGQTRESRAIEQDADALLFIVEDGVKVAKMRNGRRGDVLPLFLDGEFQRFVHRQ